MPKISIFYTKIVFKHGGRILWRRCINFLQSYSYTSTWFISLGFFARSQVEPRQIDTSEFIGCRFDGPPMAARLYLTNSAKRKRCKTPRSATDWALGRLQSNYTSMFSRELLQENEKNIWFKPVTKIHTKIGNAFGIEFEIEKVFI